MNSLNPPIHAASVAPIVQQPFRLLFLCAALFACLGIFTWALFLHLGLLPSAALPPLLWHGHEMLFGFASALIAGFLLTAVANWTGLPTATPLALLLLVALWLAARIAFLLPGQVPYVVTAILDCAFFPALTLLVARPIFKSHNRRNYFLIGLLSAFGLADMVFHLSVSGILHVPASRVLYWVIDLLAVLMLAIGGRVIPFFTERRLPGADLHRRRWLDWSVNGGGAALILLDVFVPASITLGFVSLAVAVLALARLAGWHPLKTRHEPMLWVLHLGYLWLAAGLTLRGIALLTHAFPEVTALHAITVGALGSLAIGMMTRVALGHTGRAMAAGPYMTAAFALVSVAAVLRLTGIPELLPLAGTLWAVAFAVYFIRFLPVMFTPRRS